jgi:hypothetical protein
LILTFFFPGFTIDIRLLAGMNFKRYRDDIKYNLLRLENDRVSEKTGKLKKTFHKGVYVISQYEDQTNYKIGLARGNSGLYSRIKSYQTCYPYPDELWVYFMIICLSVEDAVKFEKIILADEKLTKIMQNPVKGSLEWRIDSKYHNIKDAIREACIHPNLWQKIVVFGKNGWEVIHNDTSKKYTRSTFPLEKPPESHTGKLNVYGTADYAPRPKRGRPRKPKPEPVVVDTRTVIPAPRGKFARYTRADLAGRSILFKWDSQTEGDPRGWFKGKVLARKTTDREKAKGLNYNVKYTKAETGGEIVGIVASQLTKATHGKKWLLLNKP